MFRSVMDHLQGGNKINKIRHNVTDIKKYSELFVHFVGYTLYNC